MAELYQGVGITSKQCVVKILCILVAHLLSHTTASPTMSFSSSSLPSEDDFDVERGNGVEPTSPNHEMNTIVSLGNKTVSQVDCSCDVVRTAIADIQETREVCLSTVSLVEVQVQKVKALQIAVDGLAAIMEMAYIDTYLPDGMDNTTPTIPGTTTRQTSTGVSDSSIETENERETGQTGDDQRNSVDVSPTLHGVNFVIMEQPNVLPRDCFEVQKTISNITGIYTILPDGCGQPFQVYCDMYTDGGGWTVFQRRQDGSVDFVQKWGTYRRGFGDLLSEFWMGLDKMSRLTSQDDYQLRIDLRSYNGTVGVAEYERVRISDYWGNFRLNIGDFKANGSAGDSLSYHHSMPFTTYDRDNDLSTSNCGEIYPGGWWYNRCLYSNLNGLYLGKEAEEFARGVTWFEFAGFYDSLKFSEMKFRPVT